LQFFLSARDGACQIRGSRIAKQKSIRYLFIDAVSIKQNLDGDGLIKRVAEFSALYKTIPVIAARDEIGEDYERTIRRPWILSEMHLMRSNPTHILYVGHNNQGAYKLLGTPFYRMVLSHDICCFNLEA